MSYLNQCNCESEKSDLQLELREAKTKIITLERKLEEAQNLLYMATGYIAECSECSISGSSQVGASELLPKVRAFLSTLEGEKGGKEG